MNIIEYTEQMKLLSKIYFKDIDKDYIKATYEFFKNINKGILNEAIKSISRRSRYMPTTAELLEECKSYKKDNKMEVIMQMKARGYFKSPNEYDKAMKWLDEGIIPGWFKKDMESYYNKKLENKTLQIGD